MFKTFNRRLHRHLIDRTTKEQSWITPVSMKNVFQQAGFVCLPQLMGADWALMYQQGHKKLPQRLPGHEWGSLLKSLVCLIICLQESPGFACSFEGVMHNFLAIFIGPSPTGTAKLWDQMTHDEKSFNDRCVVHGVKDYQNLIECQDSAIRAFQWLASLYSMEVDVYHAPQLPESMKRSTTILSDANPNCRRNASNERALSSHQRHIAMLDNHRRSIAMYL